MVTLNRIVKLAEVEQYTRLIEAVALNGRPMSLPVRMRLGQQPGLAAAATGLALRRAIELQYRVNDSIRGLYRRLRGYRCDDGGFGSIAATAVALRAFLELWSLPGGDDLHAELRGLVGDALWHLASLQDDEGRIGDEIDSGICLWQLEDCREFREAVRYQDLREASASPATAPAPTAATAASGVAIAA